MTEVKCDHGKCRFHVDRWCTLGEVGIMIQEFGEVLVPACMNEVVDRPLETSRTQTLVVPQTKTPIVWFVDGSGKGRVVCVNQAKTKVIDRFTRATTNNEAEWEAVLAALGYVGVECTVEIRTDSLDVVKWIKGEYKTRDDRMRAYKERVLFMVKQKRLNATFVHVPREENLAGMVMEGKLKID